MSANPYLKQDNDKGKVWVRQMILQLWEFSWEMWEHRNSILHNTQLEASCKICDDQINDEIKKLHAGIETYDAADRWYFDIPLVLCLQNPFEQDDDG
jgi:hypothetical protein